MMRILEIGTSDFDIVRDDHKRLLEKNWILVEPVGIYAERIKQKFPSALVLHAAVGKTDEANTIFYVNPEDIEKSKLPNWLRGCNSVGTPHPTTTKILEERGCTNLLQSETVRQIQIKHLMKKPICRIKIDCEGADWWILEDIIDCIERGCGKPFKIEFEFNSLTPVLKMLPQITRLVSHGYEYKQRTGDEIVFRRSEKVFLISQGNWAFGKIYNQMIQTTMRMVGCETVFVDWQKKQELTDAVLEWYFNPQTFITGNTHVLAVCKSVLSDTHAEITESHQKRMILTSHCPILEHHYYREIVDPTYKFITYTGVSKHTCQRIRDKFASVGIEKDIPLTPFTVMSSEVTDKVRAWEDKDEIKIGVKYGRSSFNTDAIEEDFWGLELIKQAISELGEEKSRRLSLTFPYVSTNPDREMSTIYSECDVFIVGTKFEGGPLGAFEVPVTVGAPVIVRNNQGYASEIPIFRKYDTVEDLKRILESLLFNQIEYEGYRDALRSAIISDYTAEKMVMEHFVPVIYKLMNDNKQAN